MRCDRCDKELESRLINRDRDSKMLLILDYHNGIRRFQNHRLCLECTDLLFKLIDKFYNVYIYDELTKEIKDELLDKILDFKLHPSWLKFIKDQDT